MENRYMGVSALSWAQLEKEEVEVTPKKSGKFLLSDGKEIEVNEGKKIMMPRWAVSELPEVFDLVQKNLVIKDVALAAWIEENDPKTLKKINSLFYARSAYELRNAEQKELRAALSELLSVRKRKIMEAAMSGRDDAAFYSAMTPEEKRFYDDLKAYVDEWGEFLVMILSGLSPLDKKRGE